MLGAIAQAIMEGRSMSKPTENLYDGYDYSETMVGESSFLTEACVSLYTDICESYQEYQLADVMGAATCITESLAPEEARAVTEGVIKSAVDRIVAAFKKFINKVKEVFNKIITWFKVMFADADKFVSDYGDEIRTKAGKVKGYSYQGYEYKKEAGDSFCKSVTDKIEGEIKDKLNGYDYVKNSQTKDEWKAHLQGTKTVTDYDEDKSDSASEVVEKFMTENSSTFAGASTASELKDEIVDKYRDGSKSKSSIKDFSAVSVATMLAFLKKSSDVTSKLESDFKKQEDKVNAVIKKLNGISAKDGATKEEEHIVAGISYVSQIISSLLTLLKVPFDAKSQIYKEMATEYLGALKGFYRYKGTKESVEYISDAETMGNVPMICLEGGSNCSGSEDDEGDDDSKSVKESTYLDNILSTAKSLL